MSRLNRDSVWCFHIGPIAKVAHCLCCGATQMCVGSSWVRGHIIHHKNQGPDIYENIRPICRECNDNDKTFEDSAAYMVSIGTLTEDARAVMLSKIRARATEYANNPKLLHCMKCTNKRKPNSRFCGTHMKHNTLSEYILNDLYCRKELYLNIYNQLFAADPDDEDLATIAKTINDVTNDYNMMKRVK